MRQTTIAVLLIFLLGGVPIPRAVAIGEKDTSIPHDSGGKQISDHIIDNRSSTKQEVTIALPELIKTPERYDGKKIAVRGYLLLEFENYSLCSSEGEKSLKSENCLWVNFYNDNFDSKEERDEYMKSRPLPKDFNRKEVLLLATFDASLHGHLGMWPGGLKNVEYLRTKNSVDLSCVYFDTVNKHYKFCQK